MERPEDLPFEFRDMDGMNCLDIDQLSIICHVWCEQAAPFPPATHPGAYHHDKVRFIGRKWLLDENKSARAKSQLDLYNRRWKEIQVMAVESSSAASPSTPRAIPWPDPFSFHRTHFNPATEILALEMGYARVLRGSLRSPPNFRDRREERGDFRIRERPCKLGGWWEIKRPSLSDEIGEG